MSGYQFDPDRYKQSRGPKLPEGEYDAEIIAASVEMSRNSGRKMWVLDLVKADDGTKLGRYYLVLGTDYTDRNMGDLLSSVGADVSRGFFVSHDELVGKVGKVYVVHDGQYLKVKCFVPRDPNAPRTAPSGRTYTPPPPPKPAQAEAQDRDDDIPF